MAAPKPALACLSGPEALFVLFLMSLPYLMAAVLPVWLLVAILRGVTEHANERRASRVIRGQCIKCGYDLRATPERCPECGTRVAGIVRIVPDDEPPFCALDDDEEEIPDVCLG